MNSQSAVPVQGRAHKFANIPSEMKLYRQWVLWRFEQQAGRVKPTKVPYSIFGRKASVTNAVTWASFDEVVSAFEVGGWDGIGFVFTKDDPFVGIDFDDTGGDAKLLDHQQHIAKTIISYAERSPSGKGLHIIAKGSVPQGRKRDAIEIYSDTRYFTMTGDFWRNVPINDHHEFINHIWHQMGGPQKAAASTIDAPQTEADETIIERMLSAKNGELAQALYNGQWQGRYSSQSEADFALLDIIAFYTASRAQVANVFKLSALYRPSKYDSRPDLLEAQIAKAFDRHLPTEGMDAIAAMVAATAARGNEGFEGGPDRGFHDALWPDPEPLPSGLAPVAPFSASYLPDAFAPAVMDIAERMQCPPDFPAVAMMVAAGSVIGNRVAIRPKTKDSWSVTPNLWGMIVGRPGVMKSPATNEALAPLRRFETKARNEYDTAFTAYKRQMDEYQLRRKKAEAEFKKAADATLELPNEPTEPVAKRFIVSDSTYEALGAVLSHNPNGVLNYRDELASLLKHLDREENAPARGFYLSAWNGSDPYTFDRIGRGHHHIETACLSMLGSIQPSKLASFISRAHGGGEGDDGMIQRFNMLVWPDQSPEWRHVDRDPDGAASSLVNATFERLSLLSTNSPGVICDPNSWQAFLNFDHDAFSRFIHWIGLLEARLRSGELNPSIESHFAKYRKLVPALALINHLADVGTNAVGLAALNRAIAYSEYLETHALRAYGAGAANGPMTAIAILKRIRKGDLQDNFTLRDIHQRGWSNLTDHEAVKLGLELLVDRHWLRAAAPVPHATGGRPTVRYQISPKALAS